MGIFAGGVGNTGESSMVDMFDFDERRVLPRMYAPTIRSGMLSVSRSSPWPVAHPSLPLCSSTCVPMYLAILHTPLWTTFFLVYCSGVIAPISVGQSRKRLIEGCVEIERGVCVCVCVILLIPFTTC